MLRAEPEVVRGPPDLRLLPAALAVWTATVLGLVFGPAAGSAVAVLGGGVAIAGLRRRRRPSVVAAAGCAAAAGLVITAHTLLVVRHPLRLPAERAASATVRVEIGDDPRPLRGTAYGAQSGAPSQVAVPASLLAASVDD
jgi:competence protein ComEC